MAHKAILALPCWSGEIEAEPLPGGLSNEIWKVRDANDTYVVRFGEDYPFHHVSRSREVAAARAAHAAGFAPEVIFAAKGVMVTEFIDAHTLTADDISPVGTAKFIRSFHETMPAHVAGEAAFFWVFHVIRDYARTLSNSSYQVELPQYLKMSAALEAAQLPLPIVFSHNDLLPANFLDDGDRLWLIDYEYAGFSTGLFDLAGVASNSEMTPDQSRLLLETYFDAPLNEELHRAFDAMQCASLLRETMWAMVSDLYLSAPGADYGAYISENRARLESSINAYQTRHGGLAQ